MCTPALLFRLPAGPVLWPLGVGLLVSCQALPSPPTPADVADAASTGAAAEPAPLDVDGDTETVLEYLLAKYDTDRDGTVSIAEYDRDAAGFTRLDRDGDLRLSAVDFAGGSPMRRRMDSFRGQAAVMRFFQADDQRDLLERAELEAAAFRYDEDGDEALTRDELTRGIAALEELPPDPTWDTVQRMGSVEPFAAVLDAVDTDGDGRVQTVELLAFFDARDGGEAVWRSEPPNASADDASPSGSVPSTGVPVGAWAPDFSLLPPDGGEPVTLASFRDERPVALIFGSYT